MHIIMKLKPIKVHRNLFETDFGICDIGTSLHAACIWSKTVALVIEKLIEMSLKE